MIELKINNENFFSHAQLYLSVLIFVNCVFFLQTLFQLNPNFKQLNPTWIWTQLTKNNLEQIRPDLTKKKKKIEST